MLSTEELKLEAVMFLSFAGSTLAIPTLKKLILSLAGKSPFLTNNYVSWVVVVLAAYLLSTRVFPPLIQKVWK